MVLSYNVTIFFRFQNDSSYQILWYEQWQYARLCATCVQLCATVSDPPSLLFAASQLYYHEYVPPRLHHRGSYLTNFYQFFKETSENCLRALMEMLPAPKLRKVCRDLRFDDSGKKKSQIVQGLIDQTQQQSISSMFRSSVTAEQSLIKR